MPMSVTATLWASCGEKEQPPTHLIPQHVRQMLTRKHAGGGQSPDNDQLLRAAESHEGSVVTGNESPRRLAEQVAEAATMPQSGGSTDSRVKTLI